MEIELSRLITRKVEPTDVSTMVDHRLAYLSELQVERPNFRQDLKNELECYFRKSIADGSFLALVAEYEGVAVAYGGMIIKNIPGDFNQASYTEGDILNMYTVPQARRKGISSRILEQLLQVAKEMGISKVALHTSKDGEQLYRKIGFTEPVYPVLEMMIK